MSNNDPTIFENDGSMSADDFRVAIHELVEEGSVVMLPCSCGRAIYFEPTFAPAEPMECSCVERRLAARRPL